jgi:prepilin-type N-terminal cleavage/methylation domain-containing protein
MRENNRKGFTLIELMVICAIIAVLAAIAIPIYTNYVRRGKQIEAKTLLMTAKVEQEQFRAENNCYTTTAANLVETSRLYVNNRVYNTAPTITGTASPPTTCAPTGPNPSPLDDFKAVITGTLASGRPLDRWAISDRISAPVHCDGRPTYTVDQIAACAGGSTTEMEY